MFYDFEPQIGVHNKTNKHTRTNKNKHTKRALNSMNIQVAGNRLLRDNSNLTCEGKLTKLREKLLKM